MAKGTLLYFVSDLHGSSRCFRKFVNATQVYKPAVLVLGGDLAGKAIQSIVRGPNGRWHCTLAGHRYELSEGSELAELERLIADRGYYPYRAEPGELEAMQAGGTLDGLFLRLMRERLAEWLDFADTRLRPKGVPLYLMLGNDDPPELADLLDRAPWGVHAEGKVVRLDDEHEMISWGFANITPWHSHREQTEEQLTVTYERLATLLARPERAVFNVHVPPFGTQIDEAPALDADLQVKAVLGQVQMAPVGSTAVRDWELRHQPLLGLHGHIHESKGFVKIGRTLCLNPGSEYADGILRGCLVNLQGGRAKEFLLTSG